jgi:hypothetical protein
MQIYNDIFTKDECDYIISLIKESYQLEDFKIYDSEKKTKVVLPEHSQRKGINFFDERMGFVENRFLKLSNESISDTEYTKINVYRFNQYSKDAYINYHGDFDAISKGAIITIGLFLNDEYEGGEFWYKENESEYKVEQKTGSVIIFNSNIQHKIAPIIDGIKYSINCWPQYKKTKTTLI